MTFVGHTLAGTAVAVAVIPKRSSSIQKIVHFLVFVLLANLPDLPTFNWGHENYIYSHSLFVNLVFITLAILFLTFSKRVFQKIGGWTVLIGGVIAWLSHLLLDSFYNHGKGVMIFWPVSAASLALPIPWLSALPGTHPLLSLAVLQIFVLEFITFAPFLLLMILIRIFNLDSLAIRFFSSLVKRTKPI
jgi:hypothetical protein